MLSTKNNYLFISASVSLILIAFFIVVQKNKTDTPFSPSKPEIKIDEEDIQCKKILQNGLSLDIKNGDQVILAMNNNNTTLEDILELDSISALKNTIKCLGRSPLEVNIDQFYESASVHKDSLSSLKTINRISSLLQKAIGKSTVYKNIDLKIVTNIDLKKDGNAR